MEALIIISALCIIGFVIYMFGYRGQDKNKIVKYIPRPIVYTFDSEELLYLINEYRTSLNLSSVKAERKLTELAEGHCSYMISKNKISHLNFKYRSVETFKLGFSYTAEVVGAGYKNNKDLLNAYLNSSTHKNVIETPKFNYVGISTIENEKNVPFNVILFSFY